MVKHLCVSLCVVLALAACLTAAYGMPSYRGYTGLMRIPTSDALGKGDFNAGVFVEDVGSGTANDYIVNYGIAPCFEVGFDRFNSGDSSDIFFGENGPDEGIHTLLNAKYNFMPETTARPGLAAGVIDLTNDLNSTVYVVASKSLNSPMFSYQGEILNPQVHAGFGGGSLNGLFGGVSMWLGNHVQVMGEWDSFDVNAGARFRVTPSLALHAGFFALNHRTNFGCGVSYGRDY